MVYSDFSINLVVEEMTEIFNKKSTPQKTASALFQAIEIIKQLQGATASSPNIPLTLEELREIVEQLEFCGYECEGGPLNMNRAFIRLKELTYRCKPEER